MEFRQALHPNGKIINPKSMKTWKGVVMALGVISTIILLSFTFRKEDKPKHRTTFRVKHRAETAATPNAPTPKVTTSASIHAETTSKPRTRKTEWTIP